MASSPKGGNNFDRRQWRKQEEIVGGRGQQDASESEADAGSRNPGCKAPHWQAGEVWAD